MPPANEQRVQVWNMLFIKVVLCALKKNSGGDAVLAEYSSKKTLKRNETTPSQHFGCSYGRNAFFTHSADEVQILLKMRETFKYRHRLHDPDKTADILKTFPRFLNTKGLVNQDFSLIFNTKTSSKLLERWDTAFKPRIIEEAMGLTSTSTVCSLLLSETVSSVLANTMGIIN
ncbi:hypothetical protein IRJ41_003541 [Triplophysa rosa]|uniref:Uncharacterized protein n=1 Tax=Triplophysa rosa TaxID=992332 RepID=A0A9W7TUB6_TRIRA|nr:hypothetical protein IRJ41_003541 [Triplophysa rosa]